MTAVPASWPPPPDSVVVRFDVDRGGRYVSAECQLGAHHGCPGGIRDEARVPVLVCLCLTIGCACSRHLSGGPDDARAAAHRR